MGFEPVVQWLNVEIDVQVVTKILHLAFSSLALQLQRKFYENSAFLNGCGHLDSDQRQSFRFRSPVRVPSLANISSWSVISFKKTKISPVL